MGNNISLSAPLVVKLTTSSALTTKITFTQTISNVSVKVTNLGASSVKLVTASKLSVKLVVGEKGDKGDIGASPEVTLVGDQIRINGVLGPHLTPPLVNIPENIEVIASYILNGHRIVQIFDGEAIYADNETAYDGQLAITMSSVDAGSSFKAYTTGVVTEPSWSFNKGPVFLGKNGLLTQIKPTIGTVVLVGRAISQTAISLQFQQLYRRI